MANTVDQYLNYIDESYIITEFERMELLSEKLSFDKIISTTKTKLLKVEQIVGKHTDVSKIKSAAKSVVGKYKSKVMKLHKQGINPEKAGLELSKEIGRDIKKIILKTKDDFLELGTGKKIAIALGMFVVLIFLNTLILAVIFSIIREPKVVTYISCVIVAPLTEELLKQYFIQKGMPWVGTGVIFGIEAVIYVAKMMMIGMNIPKAIIMRIAGLLMHFTTTAIQKTFYEEDEALAGWIIAVFIHASWNAIAISYNDEFINWAK